MTISRKTFKKREHSTFSLLIVSYVLLTLLTLMIEI